MPSKSRRLPGGKVRRPTTRPKAVTAPEGTLEVRPDETGAVAPPPAQSATQAEIPASRRQAPQTIQLPVESMPSAAAGTLMAGAAGAAVTPRRRGAVTPRTLSGRAAARSGPSSLDVAEASLTYVRTDLLRIFILALVMVGIIVVLAVVLH
jgi:hypothetical protein